MKSMPEGQIPSGFLFLIRIIPTFTRERRVQNQSEEAELKAF